MNQPLWTSSPLSVSLDLDTHTCSRRSECSTRRLVWRVPDLWKAAEGFPVEEVHIEALGWLLEEWPWGDLRSLTDFAQHMERVRAADLSYPIILSQAGDLMDGAHRLVKAYFLWTSIRVVRFEQDPPPWRVEVVETTDKGKEA